MIRRVPPLSGAHEGAVDEDEDLTDDVLPEDAVMGDPIIGGDNAAGDPVPLCQPCSGD